MILEPLRGDELGLHHAGHWAHVVDGRAILPADVGGRAKTYDEDEGDHNSPPNVARVACLAAPRSVCSPAGGAKPLARPPWLGVERRPPIAAPRARAPTDPFPRRARRQETTRTAKSVAPSARTRRT